MQHFRHVQKMGRVPIRKSTNGFEVVECAVEVLSIPREPVGEGQAVRADQQFPTYRQQTRTGQYPFQHGLGQIRIGPTEASADVLIEEGVGFAELFEFLDSSVQQQQAGMVFFYIGQKTG